MPVEVFGESQIEWLRKYYPFKNGIPSHDTMNRVFSSLEPDVFGDRFIKWTQEICDLSTAYYIIFHNMLSQIWDSSVLTLTVGRDDGLYADV